MQGVSGDFKSAALSQDIQTVRQVSIALLDNTSIGGVITATAASKDAAVVAASEAINGVTATTKNWAYFDHFASEAGGAKALFVADPNDPSACYFVSPTSEAGWWGATLADASGVISPGETFVITYDGPKLIRTIAWYGNAFLGSPVDFMLEYDPTGSTGYTTLATVTGYSANSYTYTFNADTKVAKIRLTITRTARPFTTAALIEFEGGNVIDVSSRVVSISTISERSPDNATLVIGNLSAGELTLVLDNTDQLFSPNNSASPYQAYLRKDKKIRASVGFQYADGSSELVPIGVYYTMDWQAPAGGPTVTIKAQDRMKKLRARQYRTCPLLQNYTLDTVVLQALADAGIAGSDAVVNPTAIRAPYAFCASATSFAQYLQTLAGAAGGVAYFDALDRLHFEDAAYLTVNKVVSVLTLTDAQGMISAADSWQEGYVKNRVVVPINSLKLAASAQIWALQESILLHGHQRVTLTITFTGPAANVGAPVVTAAAGITTISWTASAYGGVLVLENTSTTFGYITAITVSGQLLQADGSNVITAEDSSLTAHEGALELSVSNPLIQSRSAAQSLAYSLLSLYSNPPSRLHAEVQSLPHLELGDRVTIASSVLGISADYWVERHSFVDDGGFKSSLDLTAVTGLLPTRATMWHQEANVLAGSALALTMTGIIPYGYYYAQNPAAVGDSFTHSVFLRAGIYALYAWHAVGTDFGIVDWYLDGVKVGAIDLYYGFSTYTSHRIGGITMAYDGYHVLNGQCNSKNASSTGYKIGLVKYWVARDASGSAD